MHRLTVILVIAVAAMTGCKRSTQTSAYSAPLQASNLGSSEAAATTQESAPPDSTAVIRYDTPPTVNVGISVEQAYAAIPHRRTVWNYSTGQFESLNIDSEFNRLITFVQEMRPPADLVTYHQDVLTALTSDREFFSQWRSQQAHSGVAQQIANHPSVRAASAAARAGYNELMAKYPNENQNNKDAFFDYHCALDFL